MKQKRAFIVLILFILLVSTLACGLFSGRDETIEAPLSSTDNLVENAVPDESIGQQNSGEESTLENDNKSVEQPESPLLHNFEMSDEYRSEEGGYAFIPIPGYEFEEFFGLSTMIAPDADPDQGPLFMLIGGTNEDHVNSEELFNNFLEDSESEEIEILDRNEISVNGKTGLLANIAGRIDGQHINGRIVVVSVTPNQQFTMFASAPRDRSDEIGSLFDAVLSSVHFFEPQEVNLIGELEETEPDDFSSDDDPVPDIHSLENFPTEAAQLPPKNFAFIIADDQGFPIFVAGSMIQYQSTNSEYIIDLVSEDQENSLTLFMPFEISLGIFTMSQYDSSSANHAPGVAVHRGLTLFTNTDGIIMVDETVENSITGSVHFTAVNEDGSEIAVTGFFNQLPLTP